MEIKNIIRTLGYNNRNGYHESYELFDMGEKIKLVIEYIYRPTHKISFVEYWWPNTPRNVEVALSYFPW